MEIPRKTTDRLLLRKPILEKDTDWFFELRSDNGFMKYMDRPCMAERSESVAHLNNILDRAESETGIQWIAEEIESGKQIGYAGLWRWDKKNRTGELGYGLDPGHTGKGYMRELIEVSLKFGFEEMGLERVEAWINPDNTASIAVVEHFGFVKEGQLRHVTHFANEYRDLLVYGLLREEWIQNQTV
ncbi:MAG: GNAT family N-acetyltransferase [Flavobacteriia bacterium]|nr:GNAT family N-acetyltransferase [Flavobacteriia bacterium]